MSIPNIYGFMGLTLARARGFFVAKVPFLALFCLTQGKEEVWSSGTQPRLIQD